MADLLENVLTASFHGSIVILAVLVLRLVLPRGPRKYLCYLWLLAGLRLLMPFEIRSDFSLQPQTPPDVLIRWEAPAPVRSQGENLPVQERPVLSQDTAAPAPVQPQEEEGLDLSDFLPGLWAAVAAVFVIYSLAGYLVLKRKVRYAVKIPGGYETENIDTAFILGFIKPRIYIPMGMAPATRSHILAHERTHLDKGDHWIKMIGFLALALHWFNPLVWVAYILLCKDIEMACDERVVQFMDLPERKAYSAALLDCSTNRMHFAASPVAFGEVSVKSRILSILNYRKPSFWAGLCSVLALAFVMVCLVTSPEASASEAAPSVEVRLPKAPPAEEVSDWGMSMIADVHSTTAMTLMIGVDVDGIPWDGTPIQKDRPFWIEHWDGEAWSEVPRLVENPDYGDSYTIDFSKDNVHRFYINENLDWTLIYGPLTEGYYRIGIRASRNGEFRAHYAQFRIWANTLTGEEAQAVARCETALDLLSRGEAYAVTLYETNAYGNLMPLRTVKKSGNSARIDSYIGQYCYNIYYCDSNERYVQNWDDGFRMGENKCISFPRGESEISDGKVRFVTTWEDSFGVAYREENTYTFHTDGSLLSADRVSSHVAEDGVTVCSQRSLTVGTINWMETVDYVQTPKNSQQSAADSPWGIFFRVDDDYLSGSGGEVWFSAGDQVGVVNYTTDSEYWLEKKDGDKWQVMESRAGDPNWGTETYRLRSASTVIDRVDWTPYYGELEAGLYRMGKRFRNGDESIIQYAEFKIYPTGNILGEGAEEAIARINGELDRIRSGSYHIVEQTGGSFTAPTEIDTVYWKYDGVCVIDYYDYQQADGYRHSGLEDDPSDNLFYDMWTWMLLWNEPRYEVYFMEGASKISDEEISFAVALTADDSMEQLFYFHVFFDTDGTISQIDYFSPGYDLTGDGRKTSFLFLDTPEEEIRAWVEKIQAEQ